MSKFGQNLIWNWSAFWYGVGWKAGECWDTIGGWHGLLCGLVVLAIFLAVAGTIRLNWHQKATEQPEPKTQPLLAIASEPVDHEQPEPEAATQERRTELCNRTGSYSVSEAMELASSALDRFWLNKRIRGEK